ncbi:MAG: RNA pseudouridine synthase [Phycisphaerales bacterium]|nr:RNA pseudouridine synthase [Phycisphaerales bacterium]
MAIPVPNAKMRLSIVHEDARVLVCDKAPGVVSEPGRGHSNDSVLNALFATRAKQLASLGEARDYGMLHRLDRMTSGCLCCALDHEAYDFLRGEWEAHRVRKSYLAIVRASHKLGGVGQLGACERPLAEKRVQGRLVSVVDAHGKSASTRWRVLACAERAMLIECEPVTGRLHQLRAHFASLGAPIEGDPIYSMYDKLLPLSKAEEPPLGLHAWKLSFAHPDGVMVHAEAPPSRKFIDMLSAHGLTFDG